MKIYSITAEVVVTTRNTIRVIQWGFIPTKQDVVEREDYKDHQTIEAASIEEAIDNFIDSFEKKYLDKTNFIEIEVLPICIYSE